MTKNWTAAVIQMVSGTDIATNLTRARHWVAEAAAQGAQLVVLPEYFAIMGHSDKDKVAQRETSARAPFKRPCNRWHSNIRFG